MHTFTVAATDPAGNTDTTPAFHAWTVEAPAPPPDTTAPQVTITGGPEGSITDTTATVTFTVDDATATVTCALDGGRPEPCTSPQDYSGLAVGEHTLTVTATDQAGNTGQATRTWTVEAPAPPPDTTPPDTTITSGPADTTTTDTTATFEFTADEPGSTFSCTLDGGDPEPCTSPQHYTGLGVGVHTFTVAATDPAGNTDPTPAFHAWSITQPAPPPDCGATVTLTSTADAWLDQNSSTANKGSDAIISVRSKQPRDNFRSLVRFTLPAVPTGCVVESATLRLYAAAHSAGRTVQAYRVTSAWAESTVTWATQPATTGAAASTLSGPGWREWSVGPQVQAMIDSSAPHGFLLRDAVESIDNEQQFHAREKGENVPQLVITYGAPS